MATASLRVSLILCVGALLIVTGCEVTRRDTNTYVREGINAIDRNTRAQLAVATANPDLAPAVLSAASDDFESRIAQTQQRLSVIEKQIAEQQAQFRALVTGLVSMGAKIGLSFIPGGSLATDAINAITALLDNQRTIAQQDTTIQVKEVDAKVDLIGQRLRHAEDTIQKVGGLQAEYLSMSESQRQELADQIRDATNKSAELRLELMNTFQSELEQELARVDLADEDRATLEKLQREIESGDFSLQERLALLVAGGVPGTVAVRAWVKTSQPSRAAGEVKDHEARILSLESRVNDLIDRRSETKKL